MNSKLISRQVFTMYRSSFFRKNFILLLLGLQYKRNDIEFKPATFRVRGDTIEIFSVTGQNIYKIEFESDYIKNIWMDIILKLQTIGCVLKELIPRLN